VVSGSTKQAKIDALLARALHPKTPIEEARTSALIALRMMAETGSMPKAPPRESQPRVAGDVAVLRRRVRQLEEEVRSINRLARETLADAEVDMKRIMREKDAAKASFRGAQAELERLRTELWRAKAKVSELQSRDSTGVGERVEQAAEAMRTGQAAPAAHDPTKPAKKPKKPGPIGTWITSRYPGRCRECGRHIRVGESVLWAGDRGATCRGCAPPEAA
jgi:hypothetical protein